MKKILTSLGFLVFIFLSTTVLSQTLVRGEYFYDSDPGLGNGIAINFTSADSVDITIGNIPTTGLISGYHHLFIRAKNNIGRWGMYLGRQIYIQPAQSILSNQVISGEYFFDTDPGVGHGTAITFSSLDSVDVTTNYPTTGLIAGYHHLFIRVKSTLGNWSMYKGKEVYILPSVNINPVQVVKAEYFFDIDPGLGNGIAINFSALDSVDISSNCVTTGLIPGYHHLFIRTKNTLGKWSMYAGKQVYIHPLTTVATQVVSAEFFYDSDPGIGNGFAVSPAFATLDSVDVTRNYSQVLPTGTHNLYIRAKDNLGQWSMYKGKSFLICNFIPNVSFTTSTVNNNICLGQQETFTDASTNTGPTPKFYWDYNNDGIIDDSGAVVQHPYPLAGHYTVTEYVTSSSGCSSSSSITITVNSLPTPMIIPSGPTTFCFGSSVYLDAGSYASYHWNNGATTETISVNAAGTYFVTVTTSVGCTGVTSIQISVSTSLNLNIHSIGSATFCQGGMVTLNTDSYTSYIWNTGATTQSISTSTGGIYSVTVTDVNNCSASASQLVTVNPNPAPVITPNGPTTFCQGGSVILNVGAYSSYHWSTNETTPTISATMNSIYSVTVTDVNGCTGTASIMITINPSAIPIPVITPSGATTFCQGGSVVLDAGSFVTYYWSNGATTSSITATVNGIYSVTVTNISGCSGTTSQLVTVHENPIPTITSIRPTTFCQGDSTILTTGIYSAYLWNSNAATTQSITVTAAGTYSVIITNGFGCTGMASQLITVNPNPIPVITPNSPVTICQGGAVTFNAGSYSAYDWSSNASPTNTQIITGTTAGFYSVIVTNSNGCRGIGTAILIVNPAPTPVITGPGGTCNHTTITLSTGSYNSFHWSTGAVTQSITTNTAGTYTVTVTNPNGCTGTASQTVLNLAFQNPVIIGPVSACSGSSVVLGVTSTYPTYNWSNGATTATISVIATGTYTVTVANGNCNGSTHLSVTILASPVPNITATNLSTYCQGTVTSTLTVGLNSAYHWSSGAISQSITVPANSPGTYSVTVTSSNGCTGSKSIILSTACTMPTGFSTTTIAATSAVANWVQPACEYGYTIRVSKHLQNSWTPHTIPPTTHFSFSGLTHNTAYDWQIQTNCNTSGSSNSGFSGSQQFTTTARLEDGETDAPDLAFTVYPNPAEGVSTVAFNTDKEEVFVIGLMDVTGRSVLRYALTSVAGENHFQLNLSGIAHGIYTVMLQSGDAVMQRKVAVQ